MGRAIVRNPKVFLFDEPLSNLDAKLRVQMRTEIKKVHQKVTTTTVYVTHDQIEAMTLADQVVIMNLGRIEQIGSPHEVYHNPKTRFVAGFIGSPAMNFLECRLVENSGDLAAVLTDKLSFPVPPARRARYAPYAGRELIFGLRPEHFIEKRSEIPPGAAVFDVQLDVVEPMGMETMVYFIINGVEVCGRVAPQAAGNAGETMPLVADLNNMHLIDPRTDQVI
jgi:multiple sugar transport system ATP-binding protein